ncbi:leucine-rich repeat family protein [Striga asiatica]|uniref:Leucine-rich repeat family protein n=1 Tax=Striga asiatica TaxID=4170 RepID=A0A5A7PUW7_STRAF|nr:leucine-rich repeat family protein [Striga asiatica]
MVEICLLLLFTALVFAPSPSLSRSPYALRISCGARADIRTLPTNTLWYKDFAYTGGIPANASRTSFISPDLPTLRYFPTSSGPNNCYNLNRVPHGHYLVRVFLGMSKDPSFENEPLFDVSLEGTLIYTVPPNWSNRDDERAFVEALVFLKEGTASICFHSTGHGSPSVLAIEILQIDNRAYYFGRGYGQGTILRTVARMSFGSDKPKFGADYGGDSWGGDRFWDSFDSGFDRKLTTESGINGASRAPNFYPEALYKTAILSGDVRPDLEYTMEVEPTRNYSLWLHFAEIDTSVTGRGQRVFDVLINGDVVFRDVDVVGMSGGVNTALVLNTTVAVGGKRLTVTLQPTKGGRAIISAIELLELVLAESKTSPEEIRALHRIKDALGLPLRLGWNGDPCVPEQHPWSGVNCQYDRNISKHVIDGLGLDNQGLSGFVPKDIFRLRHLQSINLSGNSISGVIPPSLGNLSRLEILDLSYNFLNGSIPESIGRLTSLRILDLNGNSLSGRVPSALGGRLLHGASFNFTDNSGLCGIPGLPPCGTHLSLGAIVGIGLGSCVAFLLIITCFTCWWKRRQNILRTQRIAARDAPYAKARTHFNRDVQMTRQHGHENSRTAVENGPSLLA